MIAFSFEYHLLYATLMYLATNEYLITQNVHLGIWGIIGCLISFFLPDIDIKSKASKKVPVISTIVQFLCKHRGFTHSLLAGVIVYTLACFIGIPALSYGVAIGFGSHLITDLTTPGGIPLFWPIPIKIKLPIIRRFTRLVQVGWIMLLMYIIAESDKIIAGLSQLHF